MTLKSLSLFLTFLLALLAVGCSGKASSTKVSSLGSRGYSIHGVFTADGVLENLKKEENIKKGSFYVDDICGVCLNGIKKVQLKVSNTANSNVLLEYRVFWFDKDGMDISADMDVWHPLSLDAKMGKSIVIISKSDRAVAFEVYVRKLTSLK